MWRTIGNNYHSHSILRVSIHSSWAVCKHHFKFDDWLKFFSLKQNDIHLTLFWTILKCNSTRQKKTFWFWLFFALKILTFLFIHIHTYVRVLSIQKIKSNEMKWIIISVEWTCVIAFLLINIIWKVFSFLKTINDIYVDWVTAYTSHIAHPHLHPFKQREERAAVRWKSGNLYRHSS